MVILVYFLVFCGFYNLYFRYAHLPSSFFPLFFSSSIVALLYVYGLLHLLPIIVPVIIASGCALAFINPKKIVFSVIRSPGICIYLISVLLLWYLLKDFFYLHIDEFSHWGFASKELVRTKALPQSGSNLVFIEYPPGAALYHYFILAIYGGHREGISYWAHASFLLSPLPVFLHRLKWRQAHNMLAIVSMILIIIFMFGLDLENLMVDHVVSMYFGAAVLASFGILRTPRRKLYLTPSLITISLIKQSGKFFAYSLCLIIVIDLMLTVWQKSKELPYTKFTLFHRLIRSFLLGCIIFGTCWITVGSWNQYIKNLAIPQRTSNQNISLESLWKLISGRISKEQSVKVSQVQEAIVNRSFNRCSQPTLYQRIRLKIDNQLPSIGGRITQLQIFIYIIAVTIIFFFCGESLNQRERFLSYMLILTGVMAAYLVLFVIVITFVFSGPIQYQRHINIVNGGILMFLTGCFNPLLYKIKRTRFTHTMLIVFIVLLVSAYTPAVLLIDREIKLAPNAEKRKKLNQHAQRIRQFVKSDQAVYMIFQKSLGFEYHALTYELSPIRTNRWRGGTQNEKWHWSISTDGLNPRTYILSVKEWSDMLRKSFDYVFIGRQSREFEKQYHKLFENNKINQGWPLYRIDKDSYPLVKLIPHGIDYIR